MYSLNAEGVFATLITIANNFNEKLQRYRLTNPLFDSYIWLLQNIKDEPGFSYDAIKTLSDGKIFNFFPLNIWLKRFSRNPARVIIALLYLLYFIGKDEIAASKLDLQSIQIITELHKDKSTPRLQEYAYATLTAIYQSSFVNSQLKDHIVKLLGSAPDCTPPTFPKQIADSKYGDPLAVEDFDDNSGYMLVAKEIHRKDTHRFLQIMDDYDAHKGQTEKQEQLISQMKEVIPHLTTLGFFKFFDASAEWIIRRNPDADGMKIAYSLYLWQLDTRPPYLRKLSPRQPATSA